MSVSKTISKINKMLDNANNQPGVANRKITHNSNLFTDMLNDPEYKQWCIEMIANHKQSLQEKK